MEIQKMTHAEWIAEAVRLFGAESANWRFECPSCGHIASVHDYRNAGAPEGAIGFSCVGRWMKGEKVKDAFGKAGGPCNYAGGGLIGLNPIHVTADSGDVIQVFEFDKAVA